MSAGSEKKYYLTVGLEIHAELKTQSKMFCGCKNDPDEKDPNVNVCPICLGHPGTLPVINKEAVRHVLRMGSAVGGVLANYTEFDRKNYFYPDIPKGYQISQYKFPLVKGGAIRGVALTRIHLEEDTARSSHDKGAYSLVDFNRAGLPLMELVTEPVIHSASEAAAFASELQLLLRMLGAGDANMEKGEMRVEANISVSADPSAFGTKVEVKNLNSFKSAEKAIEYEFRRQSELLEKGGVVVQETRGFDEIKGVTFSQRLKESAHDYRYFPDPDLPKLVLQEVPEFSPAAIQGSLPDLPDTLRNRYQSFGIKTNDVEVLVQSQILRNYLESIFTLTQDPKVVAQVVNYLLSDIGGMAKKMGDQVYVSLSPIRLLAVVQLIQSGELSSRGAKEVLLHMAEGEVGEAIEIATRHSLIQVNDLSALEGIITSVLGLHESVVSEYKMGKKEALKFLVGQIMKASKGAANPSLIEKSLISRLG